MHTTTQGSIHDAHIDGEFIDDCPFCGSILPSEEPPRWREVVEALKSTSWKNLDGACWCRGPAISGSAPHVHQSVCVNVRALLARLPEGMR